MTLYYHKDIKNCGDFLSITHPAWSVFIKKIDEKFLTASDIKKLVDMTYRQINDWEDRGYIDSDRRSNEKWRKFSILDLIGLILLKEVKRHGIPISRIKNSVEFSRIRTVLFERVPEFIRGRDYWLWTDFHKYLWVSENAPRKSIPNDGSKKKITICGFKSSDILIGIPVKKIIDKVVKKFDFDHFKVKIGKDGSYSFIINGVPLTLEDMPLEDSSVEHSYLLKGAIPKKFRKHMGLK